LEFREEGELTLARRALGDEYEVSQVDARLVVNTTGSVSEMADLFIRLNNAGVEPTAFSRQVPTLDDVFFKILDEAKEESRENSH
jgi:hypothetical protein